MRRRAAGFTLVELMVVVALVAIVSSIAAPGFSTLITSMNAKSASFDLVADLAMARSESLKRNASVSLVPVSGSWANGWQITAPGETGPLRQRSALSPRITIDAPAAGVVFQPNGRLNEGAANARWSITSTQQGVAPRCVIVTPAGTARAKREACA